MSQPETSNSPERRYSLRRTKQGNLMIDKLVADNDFDPLIFALWESFGPFRDKDAATRFMLRHGRP